MEGYDYSADGCYFVTMVTEHRRELFGRIHDGVMCLNADGSMVDGCICGLESRFNGLTVVNSVVMPNHVHIIMINRSRVSISEVMRQFKALTSHMYRKNTVCGAGQMYGRGLWQRSFYDVIIRNQRMFDFINNYVTINPARWQYDKINTNHNDVTDEICKEAGKLK